MNPSCSTCAIPFGTRHFSLRMTWIFIGFWLAMAPACQLSKKADLVGSTASAPPLPTAQAPEMDSTVTMSLPGRSSQVIVHFATDRKPIAGPSEVRGFGPESFMDSLGKSKVSYGTALVNIPPNHIHGVIERPKWYRFEFRNDTSKHVFTIKSTLLDKAAFFQGVERDATPDAPHSALLFVHGYNVSFDDATLRTAQLAYDLNFPGPALLFSWPSQSATADYQADEDRIVWATHDIENFIADALTNTHLQHLYIIAHSMGNRGVTSAIVSLIEKRPDLASRIQEVILAAPDIDAAIFRKDIAPNIIKSKQGKAVNVTLYVSSKDKALMASKAIHKGPRVGEAGTSIVLMPGIETVDATNVDTGFLGHSYIGDEVALLNDLALLMYKNQRASARADLGPKKMPKGTYYYFKPVGK